MTPRFVAVLHGSVFVVPLLAGVWFVAERQMAASDLDRLLAGDDSISLQQLEITCQQRHVICRDEEVLASVSSLLSSNKRSAGVGGTTYRFEFRFSTGRTYAVIGYLSDSHWYLSVPNAGPLEPQWATHESAIPLSTPDRLREILTFLELPWEQVGGLSLTVNTGTAFEYTYDPSLHGANPAGIRTLKLTHNRGDANQDPSEEFREPESRMGR